MSNDLNTKLEIGQFHDNKIRGGYRVIGRETSVGNRPWCWYSPSLEMAKLLAATLCQEVDQEVEICKYIGCVRRSALPTEYIAADESEGK